MRFDVGRERGRHSGGRRRALQRSSDVGVLGADNVRGELEVARQPLYVAAAPARHRTVLFTDAESSTRLLHGLGGAYARALADHRRALRAAFAAHGGVGSSRTRVQAGRMVTPRDYRWAES